MEKLISHVRWVAVTGLNPDIIRAQTPSSDQFFFFFFEFTAVSPPSSSHRGTVIKYFHWFTGHIVKCISTQNIGHEKYEDSIELLIIQNQIY